MSLTTKQNTINNSDEPNKVQCERCGFPCDTSRDNECPMCGRENYQEKPPSYCK